MNVYLIRIFNRAETFIGRYRPHFIAWIVYIVYESVLTGIFVQQFGELENYIVHYSLNIFLFYCHIYAMRKINFNFQLFDFLRFIPVVVLEILFYIPVLALLNRVFTEYNQPSDGLYLGINHLFIVGSVYRSIFFIMVSTGYWFISRFFSERKKLEILAKKHLNEVIVRERAEKNLALSKNAILRAQVNPHLFFNALTFIHNRIRKSDETAGDLVVTLADMMRFAMDNTHSEKETTIAEELEQVNNLIEVFNAINEHGFVLAISLDQRTKSLKIIPMVLITLVENMYKHGDLSSRNFDGSLNIFMKNDRLNIESKNKTRDEPDTSGFQSGLNNLTQRLESTYKENCKVTYQNIKTDEIFIIRIEIRGIITQ